MTRLLAPEQVAEAAALLRAGALVAFPTETVYGLGGNARDARAVAGIFAAKGRPHFNPLISHFPDAEAAFAEVRADDRARAVAARFWPGPLTLVLPRRADCRIDLLTAPERLAEGAVSPTTAQHVLEGLGGRIAAVLDGGYAKWAREGRPTETGAGTPRAAGDFTVRQVRNLMADKASVQAAMGNPAVCTLNALSAAQHTGGGSTNYGRPGRIAGSLNLPAGDLLDPATGCFLPAEELRRRLGAVGALDREVIVYCGGGIAATADALALIMLGHERVRVYDASLNEWAPDPTLPMEVG